MEKKLVYKENGEKIPAFRKEEQGSPWLLEYPALRDAAIVKHCFTTRLGGVSEGIFSSLNLSFSRGDDASHVMENYRRVAEFFGVSCDRFVLSDQTHTTNVRIVTDADAGKGITRTRDYADVDGLVTKETGLVLSTFYADCVPLYFVDVRKRAIGLSHSGWRGTVGRIGQVTVDVMRREFESCPEDIICAIGPSICQDCYEVSGDVAGQFAAEFAGYEEEILYQKKDGKYQLDLWRANERVLLDAGIKTEHISMTGLCTCCNDKLLFSHRATNGRRGNMGAFLCLKEEK